MHTCQAHNKSQTHSWPPAVMRVSVHISTQMSRVRFGFFFSVENSISVYKFT